MSGCNIRAEASARKEMTRTMNLPNKLTVLRVLMIPVFLACFYAAGRWLGAPGYLAAFVVFGLAALTDMIDGKIARAHGLITDFGKLMDPLADKLLVMAAMVSFIAVDLVHPVVVIVILSREFLVTSVRLVAASGGKVIAADIWGKIKTVFQMVWICYGLLYLTVLQTGMPGAALVSVLYAVNMAMVAVVTALTVISGLNYTWKSRALFADM